jgi:hypothetical protein
MGLEFCKNQIGTIANKDILESKQSLFELCSDIPKISKILLFLDSVLNLKWLAKIPKITNACFNLLKVKIQNLKIDIHIGTCNYGGNGLVKSDLLSFFKKNLLERNTVNIFFYVVSLSCMLFMILAFFNKRKPFLIKAVIHFLEYFLIVMVILKIFILCFLTYKMKLDGLKQVLTSDFKVFLILSLQDLAFLVRFVVDKIIFI